jgi:glycosyltransferase involved in cell wall biosynthesis
LKVLLLGEYSGLHNYLKDGLQHHGVEADVASDGDAWKQFPSDLNFASPFSSSSLVGRIFKNLKPFSMLSRVRDYELVQFMSPMILSPRLGVNAAFVDRVLDRARKSYLLGAGDDCYYLDIVHSLRYNPVDEARLIDNAGESAWSSPDMKATNENLVERVTRIIPMAYDYWIGYAGNAKCNTVIPMPINIHKYQYQANKVAQKLVFYHGITRPGFKGSRFIRQAFEQMQQQYGDCAEFIIAGRVPIVEYVGLVEKANVIVDQALSYSYGMNALISMAMGKVVMSGAEPEIFPFYEHGPCPIINIQPDVQQICQKIEWLIQNRQRIQDLGEASRAYVEANHSHVLVAEKFLHVWNAPR